MYKHVRVRDRVVVQMRKTRKYGTVVGECNDKIHWMVLLDGNLQTSRVHNLRMTLLKPEQLAFNLAKVIGR